MLRTFAMGGVHPPENKITATKKIQELPPPALATIPVSQHIGAPSKVLVKKGDEVKVGQVIASSEGFVSTNIHSSVSGKVSKIDTVVDSSGYKKTAVLIQVNGDEWLEDIDRSTDLKTSIDISGNDIVQKLLSAGIVGLGGATFPSHVKMSVPKGKKADYLIINGVECEPYLTSDHSLMLEKANEIITGIHILMKGLDVDKAIIGIENNKPDAIELLSSLLKDDYQVDVMPLKVQYPQGGEKQLIKATINREVPSGALPIDVGAVVFNVGTTFAVYEAVQKNKPLFERVVTLTGKSVKNPGNFKVRLGTPVQNLIDAAGGLPDDTGKVINGGPMMGKAIANFEVPVVKGSSGILILPENEARRKEMQACIRCSKCISVCPMGLEPYLLQTVSEKALWERAEADRITDCIECGSCSYTCPANRPLLDYIRHGKQNVIKLIRSRKSS